MADQQRRYTEVETEGHPDLDPDFPPYNPVSYTHLTLPTICSV